MINQINIEIFTTAIMLNWQVKALKLFFQKIQTIDIAHLTKKIDLDEDDDQYQLYLQFVAWYCNGSSMVPLNYYAKNQTYKKNYLTKKIFQ